MAEWLILLVLVAAIVVPVVLHVGFAGCSFEHGQQGTTCVIDYAVARGRESIRLAWRCDSTLGVRREFRRTKLPAETEERFFDAVSSPQDDNGLIPATSYRYQMREVSSDGEPSALSHPVDRTTLSSVTFPADESPLSNADPNWEGYCLVQRIEGPWLSTSGVLVSLTLHASAGASLDRIYISQPDPTGDVYDFVDYRQMVHDIDWHGTPLVMSANEVKILPAVGYPLEAGRPLLIAFEFSPVPPSEIMYNEVGPEEAVAYYKSRPPEPLQPGEDPEARKKDRTGYARWPEDTLKGGIYLIEKIEVG